MVKSSLKVRLGSTQLNRSRLNTAPTPLKVASTTASSIRTNLTGLSAPVQPVVKILIPTQQFSSVGMGVPQPSDN